jgi:hypothetical protein
MKSSNHTLNVHRLTSCTLLYSSSLLLACLLHSSSLPLYSGRLLTYLLTHSLPAYSESAHLWRRSTDTTHRKHMPRDAMHYCDVTAHAPVPRTKRKHMSRDRYLLLCDSPRTQRKHSFPYCCVRVFRAWPRDEVLLLLRVGTCLLSCGLAIGSHITIPCSLVYDYQRLEEIWFLHIQTEAASFSDSLVTNYQTALRHASEHRSLNLNCYKQGWIRSWSAGF